MACRPVGRRSTVSSVVGHVVAQLLADLGAARVEAAAGRRVGRRRHVAGEDDPLAPVVAARPGRGSAPTTAAPWCTGGAGWSNSSSRVPTSTIWPRYITATRSQRCSTTARSWDTNRIVKPRRRCRSRSRLRICERIDTSSADTGSSAIEELRLDGERPGDADALALAAAELVREARATAGSSPTRSITSSTRAARCAFGDAVGAQPLGDRVADRRPRVERRVRVLEHDLDVLAQRPQLGRRRRRAGPGRRSAACPRRDRAGAAGCATAWSCRSPTRRRGRAPRPRRCRGRRGRRRARAPLTRPSVPPRSGNVLTMPRASTSAASPEVPTVRARFGASGRDFQSRRLRR